MATDPAPAWRTMLRASRSAFRLRAVCAIDRPDRGPVTSHPPAGDLTTRLMIVYGLSAAPDGPRDASRMRGFPDPNPSLQAVDISGARADRGHFVAHTAGGPMDMNLFPQRRDLNRGWSAQGKQYRLMERYL